MPVPCLFLSLDDVLINIKKKFGLHKLFQHESILHLTHAFSQDALQSMNNAFKFRYVTKSLKTYISLYLLVFAVQPSINCFISSKQINPFTVNVFM